MMSGKSQVFPFGLLSEVVSFRPDHPHIFGGMHKYGYSLAREGHDELMANIRSLGEKHFTYIHQIPLSSISF